MSTQKEEIQRQLSSLQDEQMKLGRERQSIRDDNSLNPNGPIRIRAINQRLVDITTQMKGLMLQSRKLADDDAAAHAQLEALSEQSKREDRSFWFRRFHTSLAIAHGAGFAAVSSKLFDPALKAATAGYAFYPMSAFAIGMVLAGLIPVALYRDAGRWSWGLAGASAILFCGALMASLIAVWRQTGWPFP